MNQRHQKHHNLLAILEELRFGSGISQSEIASVLSLRASTVSNLMRDLKSEGMVIPVAKGKSGSAGGKKADLLGLDPEYGCFGGLYLQSGNLTCRVLDFCDRVLEEKREDLSGAEMKKVTDILSKRILSHHQRYPGYKGAGIAVSSIVTPSGGIAASSHFSQSYPGAIENLRQRHEGLFITAENDANALVYYDLIRSRRRGPNIAHLLVREDPFTIGAGLILDGEMYRGPERAAGEVEESLINRDSHTDVVADLIRFLRQFLDLDAVYISTPSGTKLERELNELVQTGSIAAELIGDNIQAANGAAMLVAQMHVESILGGNIL